MTVISGPLEAKLRTASQIATPIAAIGTDQIQPGQWL